QRAAQAALVEQEQSTEQATPYSVVLPRTELEQAIAAIWRSVLLIEEVGIDDSFFDLGGHSLLMVRVHNQLQRQLGVDLQLVDLFRYHTIRMLTSQLTAASTTQKQVQVEQQEQRSKALQTGRQRQQQRQRQLRQQRQQQLAPTVLPTQPRGENRHD
ncbi:MAG: phosphopantetheine-binding protein, partial [Cyanobacteria bacterium P01_H01_bin.121]